LKKFRDYLKCKSANNISQDDIQCYISSLAVDRKRSASSQNQGFNALIFVYKNVLHKKPGDLSMIIRAKNGIRIPVVMTNSECMKVINNLNGVYKLMA
jgi:hypothetical protein